MPKMSKTQSLRYASSGYVPFEKRKRCAACMHVKESGNCGSTKKCTLHRIDVRAGGVCMDFAQKPIEQQLDEEEPKEEPPPANYWIVLFSDWCLSKKDKPIAPTKRFSSLPGLAIDIPRGLRQKVKRIPVEQYKLFKPELSLFEGVVHGWVKANS